MYGICLTHAIEIKSMCSLWNVILLSLSRREESGMKSETVGIRKDCWKDSQPTLCSGPLSSQPLPWPFIHLTLSSELHTQLWSYLLEIMYTLPSVSMGSKSMDSTNHGLNSRDMEGKLQVYVARISMLTSSKWDPWSPPHLKLPTPAPPSAFPHCRKSTSFHSFVHPKPFSNLTCPHHSHTYPGTFCTFCLALRPVVPF